MKIEVGDKIRLIHYICGQDVGYLDFKVEKFRFCLGIFTSPACRKAGEFVPLCKLYEPSAESKGGYISNYGSYQTDMIPSFMQITEIEIDGYSQ